MSKIEVPIDHNFHLMNDKVMKEWESRRSPEYREKNNGIISHFRNFPLHLDMKYIGFILHVLWC